MGFGVFVQTPKEVGRGCRGKGERPLKLPRAGFAGPTRSPEYPGELPGGPIAPHAGRTPRGLPSGGYGGLTLHCPTLISLRSQPWRASA
jgi:hypothetical protein